MADINVDAIKQPAVKIAVKALLARVEALEAKVKALSSNSKAKGG